MVDGEPEPIPGKLYYRGYDVEDIVTAHMNDGTFGFEEVIYLLHSSASLPSEKQLKQFDTVLSAARRLPPGFTEDMIIKAPSRNVMNKLARGVLSLYSYDRNPDDTSVENLVRQSIELTGRIPVIVANAYAVKKHYYDGESLYIHVPDENLSVAENFLYIRGRTSSHRTGRPYSRHVLILHAETAAATTRLYLPRALLHGHGYLWRDQRRGEFAQRPAARRRERQSDGNVPRHPRPYPRSCG